MRVLSAGVRAAPDSTNYPLLPAGAFRKCAAAPGLLTYAVPHTYTHTTGRVERRRHPPGAEPPSDVCIWAGGGRWRRASREQHREEHRRGRPEPGGDDGRRLPSTLGVLDVVHLWRSRPGYVLYAAEWHRGERVRVVRLHWHGNRGRWAWDGGTQQLLQYGKEIKKG